MTAVSPVPAHISKLCPSREKPVTSVHAWIPPRLRTASAAYLFRAAMDSTMEWRAARLKRPPRSAVVRIPVPRGFVRISTSPSRTVSLRRIRLGETRPETQRPYLGMSSFNVWPPTRMAPASATLSHPPRSMALTAWGGRESGNINTFMHSRGSPPMAHTSDNELAAAIRPYS